LPRLLCAALLRSVAMLFKIASVLVTVVTGTSLESRASGAGEGVYNATMVTLSLPRAEVESMLAEGLELGTPPDGVLKDGEHPVVFAFGYQTDVRPVIHVGKFPFDWTYQEFILAVPFVRFAEHPERGQLTHPVNLYLDDLPPVVLGWVYGLPKQLADSFEVDETSYRIFAKPGNASESQSVVASNWIGHGEKKPAMEFPNFGPLSQGLQLPLVGAYKVPGFMCSNFNWGLDVMQLTAATGSVEVDASFVGQIQPRNVSFVGVDESPISGYLMETKWTMSAPFECGKLANTTLV